MNAIFNFRQARALEDCQYISFQRFSFGPMFGTIEDRIASVYVTLQMCGPNVFETAARRVILMFVLEQASSTGRAESLKQTLRLRVGV
ncbi:hypothetical protein IV203_014167 [Nitzschia inconspicua]|uniref:Uncharacterized protein n=1 Tax=Nitzschia inconspicua TaxID=303405 RepID=A0A9K3Q802_9STRA|nr:hypothetical protein IV203_014167 [Nitzschia inconspicua]